VSRRHEQVDEYAPGNEDHDYDTARQRLVDAHCEGLTAGRRGAAADDNPYYTFEPQHNEWHHGRLEGLAETGRVAATAALKRRFA
jgi:ribosome modulation factor